MTILNIMRTKYILITVFAAMVTSCGNKNTKEYEQPGNAILEVPERVDMGDFEGPYYKKFVNIEFKNTGTDTLYIRGALSDCDCTELEVVDSVVGPQKSGMIIAYLDLGGLPDLETEKQFMIVSNNKKAKAVYVTLVGRKK